MLNLEWAHIHILIKTENFYSVMTTDTSHLGAHDKPEPQFIWFPTVDEARRLTYKKSIKSWVGKVS